MRVCCVCRNRLESSLETLSQIEIRVTQHDVVRQRWLWTNCVHETWNTNRISSKFPTERITHRLLSVGRLKERGVKVELQTDRLSTATPPEDCQTRRGNASPTSVPCCAGTGGRLEEVSLPPSHPRMNTKQTMPDKSTILINNTCWGITSQFTGPPRVTWTCENDRIGGSGAIAGYAASTFCGEPACRIFSRLPCQRRPLSHQTS